MDLVAMLCVNIHPDIANIDMAPIKRAKLHLTNVYKQLSPKFPEIPFEPSLHKKSDYQRFKRIEHKLKLLLKHTFTDHGITLDMLNAIILLTDRAYQGSLKTKNTKLQEAWEIVRDSLFEFYEQIDPDFQETSWMKLGTALSRKIEEVVGM